MADVALVCVRDDAWKGDLLAVALERYGFTVCRSASVFEDFSGYSAVVVLISPGAARSELVMGTATRAHDWGKLIPVFITLCPLPDRLVGVALHDLSSWGGEAEDPVVKAIGYHAHRLAGGPGKPNLGPDRSLRRLARESAPLQLTFEPNDFTDGYNTYQQTYIPPPSHDRFDYDRDHGRGQYHARVEPYFVAAAQNELDHYGNYAHPAYEAPAPLDVQIAVSPNEAARRRAYYADSRAEFVDPYRSYDRGHEVDWQEEPRQDNRHRRIFPGLFSVLIGATLLMTMAWFEEARTQQVAEKRATPAIATAALSEPALIQPEAPKLADLSR